MNQTTLSARNNKVISFKSSKINLHLNASTPKRDLPSYFSPSNSKYSTIHNESIESPQHFDVPLERFREVSDILPKKIRRAIESTEKCEMYVRVEEKKLPNKDEMHHQDKVLRFDEKSIKEKLDALKCERSCSRMAMVYEPNVISPLDVNIPRQRTPSQKSWKNGEPPSTRSSLSSGSLSSRSSKTARSSMGSRSSIYSYSSSRSNKSHLSSSGSTRSHASTIRKKGSLLTDNKRDLRRFLM